MILYESIVDLPLRNFIDASCDANVAALIVSGLPESEEDKQRIISAWDNIQQEYSDTIGDSEYVLYLNLQRNLAMLQLKINQLETCLLYMESKTELSEFFLMLEAEDIMLIKAELGFIHAEVNKLLSQSLKFDILDVEGYKKDIKRSRTLGKNLKVVYDRKKMELVELEKKGQSNKGEESMPVSRRYFQTMLIILGDSISSELSDNMSTFQFCERIRRFNKQQEYLSRQTRKNGK